ncbi:hypothetical protein [Paenibacillus sonchi]|uniref:hypothetical protein n=1 Tax=Paenibacillus sonchi TaxID=373687 RepID=UPI001F2B4CCF|nr:hypothetical protein [Paenibacillus sonchi]
MPDKDGGLDRKLRGFVQQGGRLLLLEQQHLSPASFPWYAESSSAPRRAAMNILYFRVLETRT